LYVEQIGNCLYNRTDFYVNGDYDSSTYDLIGCDARGQGIGNPAAGGGGGGKGGGKGPKENVWSCASEAAAKVSIAGAVQRFGIGNSGVSGFVTNALGGNAFSGLTDLIQSFGSGEAGGHSVFYNMGQGLAAGPTQGFGPVFGKSIEGTPWGSGPVDVASTALVSGGMKVITGR